MECSICLETYVHPVRLPCRHVFCFLCVKGISQLYKRCAICRQTIPDNYFDNPVLIKSYEKNNDDIPENCAQWFYQGKNGWWLYDKRAIEEIEEAFKSGSSKCQLLIAGFLYIIDFVKMIQYRKDEPHRQRRIKRDELRSTESKGVAGLKIDEGKSRPQSDQLMSEINKKEKEGKNEVDENDDDGDDDNEQDEIDDEEKKKRLTNQRLDELAFNFMQSLNFRESNIHETYL